jgi:hypothetical protein
VFHEDHSSLGSDDHCTCLLFGGMTSTSVRNMLLTQLFIACQIIHATLLLPALRPRAVLSIIPRLTLLLRTTSSRKQSWLSAMWYVFYCLGLYVLIKSNQSQLHGAARGLNAYLPQDNTVCPVCYMVNARISILPLHSPECSATRC